jgi:hypothetical protein
MLLRQILHRNRHLLLILLLRRRPAKTMPRLHPRTDLWLIA